MIEQTQLELDIFGEDAAFSAQSTSNVIVLTQYLVRRQKFEAERALDSVADFDRAQLVSAVLNSVDDVWQHLDVM